MKTNTIMAVLMSLAAVLSASGQNLARVKLQDGSIAAGEISQDAIQLEGGVGAFNIPLSHVSRIDAQKDGNVTAALANGDKLSGKLGMRTLQLSTVIGILDIKTTLIRSVGLMGQSMEGLLASCGMASVEALREIGATIIHGSPAVVPGHGGGDALVFCDDLAEFTIPKSSGPILGGRMELWAKLDDKANESCVETCLFGADLPERLRRDELRLLPTMGYRRGNSGLMAWGYDAPSSNSRTPYHDRSFGSSKGSSAGNLRRYAMECALADGLDSKGAALRLFANDQFICSTKGEPDEFLKELRV